MLGTTISFFMWGTIGVGHYANLNWSRETEELGGLMAGWLVVWSSVILYPTLALIRAQLRLTLSPTAYQIL